MAKKKKKTPPKEANQLVYEFLKANNIIPKVTATKDKGVTYTGDGFVLTDKPLIKIKYRYASK
jgi:hypothetical protein